MWLGGHAEAALVLPVLGDGVAQQQAVAAEVGQGGEPKGGEPLAGDGAAEGVGGAKGVDGQGSNDLSDEVCSGSAVHDGWWLDGFEGALVVKVTEVGEFSASFFGVGDVAEHTNKVVLVAAKLFGFLDELFVKFCHGVVIFRCLTLLLPRLHRSSAQRFSGDFH